MLEKMRKAPELTQNALQTVANYWHTKILPKHFLPNAGALYEYAFRGLNYRESRDKRGKPDLVRSGSMRHDLTAKAAFVVGRKTSVDLKMWARVLNFCPTMPQNSDAKYVHHAGRYKSRGYPNMKRELKVILPVEHEAMVAVAQRSLEIAFGDTEGRESDD